MQHSLNTLKPSVKGYYKIEGVNKETGETRVIADWFPNLITDTGLNRIGIGGFMDNCYVGSGSSTPSIHNSNLAVDVARTSTVKSTTYDSYTASEPYYSKTSTTYRFGAGVAAGNLSEVGVGWKVLPEDPANRDKYELFSRALILDTAGNPTTITILSDEFLDVTYELRLYPPEEDAEATILLETTYHTCRIRPSMVNSAAWWAPKNGRVSIANSAYVPVYSGPIGTVFQSPSGSASGYGSTTGLDYVNNSLNQRWYTYWDLDSANFPTGIRSMWFATTMGTYQIEFSPTIMKDNTRTFRIDWGVSWARR